MPFCILSLSGGGIRGIFQALYLEEVARRFDRPLREYFDLVAGTSTGAIIALGVALGVAPGRIVELFEKHGHEIFPRQVQRSGKRLISWLWRGPRYSQEPLQKVRLQGDSGGDAA